MIPDPVHKPKDTSAAMTRSMVAVALVALIAVAASVWYVGLLRLQWFEQVAEMDDQGVDVDARVVAQHCAGRSVTYSWIWNGTAYTDSGWPCGSACHALVPGTAVRIRFLPTRQRSLRCLPTDVERGSGPPGFWPPIFFILLLTWALLLPLYRHRRWRKRGSVARPEH